MREPRGAEPPRGPVLNLVIAAFVTAALTGAAATAVGADPPPPPVPAKQPVRAAPVQGHSSGTVGLVTNPRKPTQQELAAGGVVIPGVVVKRTPAAGGDPAAPPTPLKSEGTVRTPAQGNPSGAVGNVPAVAAPRTAAELAAAGVKAN